MKIQVLGSESRNARTIDFLEQRGCEVRAREDLPALEEVHDWGAAYLISNGFGPIIREPLLGAYAGRIVNIHPAYLPYGRGIFPNFWCLLDNQPIGVTIHLIDAGIDTGAILARHKVPVGETDNLRSLHEKLLHAAEALFFEIWDDFVAGGIEPEPQEAKDHGAIYHSRAESERLLDLLPNLWETPIERVREMGREISSTQLFWSSYHRELELEDGL